MCGGGSGKRLGRREVRAWACVCVCVLGGWGGMRGGWGRMGGKGYGIPGQLPGMVSRDNTAILSQDDGCINLSDAKIVVNKIDNIR